MEPIDLIKTMLSDATDAIQSFQPRDLSVTYKDQGYVTEADLASEKIILGSIQQHFPNDIIYSEEFGLSSTDRKAGQGIWIVDPLDGTANFANSYPFYCVSIGRGVIRDDESVRMTAGGVMHAVTRDCYTAELGKGALCNDQPLRVRDDRPLNRGFLCTGFYYDKGSTLAKEVDTFLRVQTACESVRRDGAAALDLCLVARGIYDAFWERGLAPWDVAAGSLIVSEAGGSVVNYSKDAFDVEETGIICGGPKITKELIAIVR